MSLLNKLSLSAYCWSLARHAILAPRHFPTKEVCAAFVQIHVQIRRGKKDDARSLFIPVPVKISNNPDDINVGEELTGKLKKDDLLRILNEFNKLPDVKMLSEESGLDNKLYHQTFVSFRRFCLENEKLPVDLHVTFSDILQGSGHVNNLFPYFFAHAREIFPHLECMDDLKKISDLRLPANWYPEARQIKRRVIFHAGPTNSGKTYHALERFISSKSGIYCGPLKMLAAEVHAKTNSQGTMCDLVTGEERRYAKEDKTPSSHVSCTVEMASVTNAYEVAVIDEIQMVRDGGRGWAWTRALLGVVAEEIHLCGEGAAIDLVKEICAQIGEDVEVRKYKRLTKLTVESKALISLDHVADGDCIVCFSKNDIYTVSRQIEKMGRECAVIYGGLPPGTKLAQASKFNDPNSPCKIMVATDAIGMGLNLSIRRIIFYSLMKPTINEKGEKEMDTISTSQALQIAGRAGRYGTQFEHGYATAFRRDDLPTLKALMEQPVDSIEAAGLHPTAEQIELFAYHLPNATLSNLIDIFVSLCQVDSSHYFMCNVEDFKFLADMIQHVPLPLRARYVFCCSPINKKMPFVCTMFLKFSRQYSRNEALTFNWLCRHIGWPLSAPQTIVDLVHLESVFDVLDLYLWLSYRFADLFPEGEVVRDMQAELDQMIQEGVVNITKLLRASESSHSHGTMAGLLDEHQDTYQQINKKKTSLGFKSYVTDIVSSALTEQPRIDSGVELTTADEESNARIYGRGRLTEKLISQGLISEELLDKLKQEWANDTKTSDSKKASDEFNRKKPGKRKK